MPSCAIITCRIRSQVSCVAKDGISFHRFPKEPDVKEKWIDATGRYDWFPLKTSTICSKHFKANDYLIKKSGKKYLKPGAFPSERVVVCRSFPCDELCASKSVTELGATQSVKRKQNELTDNVSKYIILQCPEEDPLESDSEVSVSIKLEMEDDTSEHEDDLSEKLAKKRRREEEEAFEINKKIKEEHQEVQIESQIPTQRTDAAPGPSAKSDRIELSDIFMSKVINSQNEILSILKRQVLLPDPNPDLLTFLRFLGMKMQRIPDKKRTELQDKITEMVLKDC